MVSPDKKGNLYSQAGRRTVTKVITVVFWTNTLEERALDGFAPDFHARFREITLRAAARVKTLFCPGILPDAAPFAPGLDG